MPSADRGIRLGISFARWRAEDLGLDYRRAFTRLCEWHFDLVRLSTSWQEVEQSGYSHLDWLVSQAESVGQPFILTVGMKALGWPEFYLPAGAPAETIELHRALLHHVARTIERYRDRPHLTAWQVENEPFNRSGPQAQTVVRSLVRREAALARRLDPARPLMITTFAHFDEGLDRSSSRFQGAWRRRFRLVLPPEREALSVLRPRDILGLDVYRSIGWRMEDRSWVAHAAADQLQAVGRWKRIAESQRKRLWISEAQAEPWEASRATHGDPRSVQPEDVLHLYQQLSSLGPEAILLWGSEYWLWRDDNGDPRWSSVVQRMRAAR